MRCVAVALALLASASHASADVASDVLGALMPSQDAGCVPAVKVGLTDAIRSGIETEVKRREALIKDPASLSALGCIDQLMDVNIDFAIQVPDVQRLFQNAVSDAESKICRFAASKLQELTAPLQQALSLPSFDAINVPGLSGAGAQSIDFGTINLGAGPGRGDAANATPRQASEGSLTERTLRELYGIGGTAQ